MTYLCISGIGIEHVGEKFTRAGHARNDQSMNIKAIHDKKMGEVSLFALWI
jgi:hypothetical protein